MNILLDGVPYTVNVGGKEYPINYGFRTSILYELLIQDDSLSDAEKIMQAINLYYPQRPDDLNEAVMAIVWFYSLGKSEQPQIKKITYDDEDEDEDDEDSADILNGGEMVYSFEYDAPYIYAAFLEQYGVDLTELDDEELHWWKFKSMFQALGDKTRIMQIIGYRAIKITDKMSKDQRDYYRRMKKIYALPLSQSEVEKQNAIIDALRQGKDVSALL